MASEKRILIREIKPECKFREIHETTAGGHTWVDFMCGKSPVKNLECDEKCFEQCEWKELTGISTQEAIRKMCNAYFKAKDKGSMESERVVAALNALLDTPTLEERLEEIAKNNPGIPDYDEFYKALREGK